MDLVKVRKQTGLTQTEFWGRVGTGQSAGSRYENGRPMPRPIAMLVEMFYTESQNRAFDTIRANRPKP